MTLAFYKETNNPLSVIVAKLQIIDLLSGKCRIAANGTDINISAQQGSEEMEIRRTTWNEEEIGILKLIEQFVYAEITIQHKPMYMRDWLRNWSISMMNDKNILEHAGSISYWHCKKPLMSMTNTDIQTVGAIESIKELEKDIQKLNTNKRKKEIVYPL